jgi:hypothetical protein
MQEWFNLARDNVVRHSRTPPLVSFLVGLIGWFCSAYSSLMMEAVRTSETSVDIILHGSITQKTALNITLLQF